jgi:threonine dehydratase
MKFMLTRMKTVVEPSGAVPAAALMQHKLPGELKRVGVVVSGGNVDLGILKTLDCKELLKGDQNHAGGFYSTAQIT